MRKLCLITVFSFFLGIPGQGQQVTKSAIPVTDIQDDRGQPVNAHGGGILFYGNTYYLFGEIKKGKTWLVPDQSWEDYRVPAGGISCYSSKDLVSWKYEGVALGSQTGNPTRDLDTGRVIERPKVVYNEKTRKFVMWMHIDKSDYGMAKAGVAISDRPEGPYQYLRSVQPNGQDSRDMTLFKDDDGKAYLIYSSEKNNTMQICLLSEDYLTPTTNFIRILKNQNREAPALFKQNGKYYLITSLCSGWDPNAALYSVADSIMGNWENRGNPCSGPGSERTFEAQSSFVLPIAGAPGNFLFMADRWNKTDLPKSGYLWLPLEIHNEKVIIKNRRNTGLPAHQYSSEVTMVTDTNGNLSSAKIGPAGKLTQTFSVRSLAVIQYTVDLQNSDSTTKANSSISFYDESNRELLSLKNSPVNSLTYKNTGNYTEAPPFSYYAVIRINADSQNTGIIHVKNLVINKSAAGPDTPRKVLCNLDEYIKPFWKSDTIYAETVLLYSVNGKPATGQLLFNPDRLISIKSFDYRNTFKLGKDFTIQGRTITRSAGSIMPFRADTSFDTRTDLAWFNLQSQWVLVTYTHHGKWSAPTASFKGEKMPLLLKKLRAKSPVKIVGYGMSITRGMNISSYDEVPPYMPTYLDLFTRQLRKNYQYENIELFNAGLPGATISWGADYAEKYINPLQPDLVVVDFGMNDFWRYTPEEFGKYIQTILNKVKAEIPDAEFLLIATMDFDPAYILDTDKNKLFYTSNMQGYKKVISEMERNGIATLDMMTLSDTIYQRKKAKDCITNPLHPNDYMARWYAQSLTALLCP